LARRRIAPMGDQRQFRPGWRARYEEVAGEGTEGLTAALDGTMDEHAKLVSRLESGDLDLALLVSTDIDRTWIPATLSADHLYSEELFPSAPKAVGPMAVGAHVLPELT